METLAAAARTPKYNTIVGPGPGSGRSVGNVRACASLLAVVRVRFKGPAAVKALV